MNLHQKHMELVDAVNYSTTTKEHVWHSMKLYGWREGVRDAGLRVSLCAADEYYLAQGIDRPMCCGVWLDWAEGCLRLPGNGFTVWTRRMGL